MKTDLKETLVRDGSADVLIAYWSFPSRAVSKVLYPGLKAGRNLLLKMLRITKINNLGIDGNDRF